MQQASNAVRLKMTKISTLPLQNHTRGRQTLKYGREELGEKIKEYNDERMLVVWVTIVGVHRRIPSIIDIKEA